MSAYQTGHGNANSARGYTVVAIEGRCRQQYEVVVWIKLSMKWKSRAGDKASYVSILLKVAFQFSWYDPLCMA